MDEEGFGVGEATGHFAHARKAVETGRDIGIISGMEFLAGGEGFEEQRFGIVEATVVAEDGRDGVLTLRFLVRGLVAGTLEQGH